MHWRKPCKRIAEQRRQQVVIHRYPRVQTCHHRHRCLRSHEGRFGGGGHITRLACMHLPIHSLAGMPAGDTSLVSSARQPGLNQKQAPLSRPLMPSRCGHSCGNELGGYYFNSGRPSVHMRALMTLCGALKRSAGHGKRGEFRRDSREAPLAR